MFLYVRSIRYTPVAGGAGGEAHLGLLTRTSVSKVEDVELGKATVIESTTHQFYQNF